MQTDPYSAGVAEAGGDAVDAEEQGAGDVGVALGVAGALAPALQQRDLEVVQRGEVIVADAQGAGEVGGGGEELLAAGEAEDFADGQLVLGADLLPRAGQLGRDEAGDVVAADLEVGLEEG